MKKSKKSTKHENLDGLKGNNQMIISMILTQFLAHDDKQFIKDIVETIKSVDRIEIGQAQLLVLKALNDYKALEKLPDEKELLKGDMSTSDKLPTVETPYLPPLQGERAAGTYTLVLDLDETLVHFEDVHANSTRLILRSPAKVANS
jgi:predicted enzyme involved in methoxymalonyl-ACP biosynthesis